MAELSSRFYPAEVRRVKWKTDSEGNFPKICPGRQRIVKCEKEVKSKKMRSITSNTYPVGAWKKKVKGIKTLFEAY